MNTYVIIAVLATLAAVQAARILLPALPYAIRVRIRMAWRRVAALFCVAAVSGCFAFDPIEERTVCTDAGQWQCGTVDFDCTAYHRPCQEGEHCVAVIGGDAGPPDFACR